MRPIPNSMVDPSSTSEAMLADGLRDGLRIRRPTARLDIVDEAVVEGGLDQRLVHRHQDVEVKNVDEAVAQSPRHLRVYLGDHQAGIGCSRLDDVYRDPQAAAAQLIGQADLDQSHVDGHLSAGE